MQQPSQSDTRNVILAAVLSLCVFVLWQELFVAPEIERARQAEAERIEQQQDALEAGGFELGEDGAPQAMTREDALGADNRIEIDTPTLGGSLSLTGGVIDALDLHDYQVSLDEGAPDVELLHPMGVEDAYFAVFGWGGAGGVETPGPRTEWTLAPDSPETLRPGAPVTLVWDNQAGLRFTRRIEVDDRYLFTVTQEVENVGDEAATLRPVGRIERHGLPELENFFVLHEGAVGGFDGTIYERHYDDLADAEPVSGGPRRGEVYEVADVGWLGFTDKYWMTVLAPADGQPFEAQWDSGVDAFGQAVYRAIVRLPTRVVEPGETSSATTHFFAGAKEMSAIRDYQYLFDGEVEPEGFFGKLNDFFFYESPSRFVDSVDWGWFFFLTKPIFEMLSWLYGLTGNMGVAIILLTVVFKTLLFPLAYKSYVSMAGMKRLQPDMKKIQERFGDDRQRMQQEMMALYKREKVNPAAGCLPILVQIPIFFSLYKVLFVTIETRHAPFFGWIQDLSAPDPTSIFNLFGLLPFEVPLFLMIGIWPILMGITMWLQMMLNPQPTDPVQQRIFAFMPLIFTFLLGTFASGLVIYWTANNVLTILQQALIMRSQGVEIDLVGNVRSQFGLPERKRPAAAVAAAAAPVESAPIEAGDDAPAPAADDGSPAAGAQTAAPQPPAVRRAPKRGGKGKRASNRRR